MAVTRTREPRDFRTDIQALRAVAVLAVVVNHFWPDWLPGGYVGVDVFFVISGFLITSHLMRRPPQRFGDLAAFWGRRIRRLLPAAILVILVTLLATRLIDGGTLWEPTARAGIAAGTYWINWQLAADAVDYLAHDDAATPLQHYWSLSVEEQFYLVWPILVLVLTALAGRRGWLRRWYAIGFGAVAVASLTVSAVMTATSPAQAYFVTQTRAWEFATGALVAVLLSSATHWAASDRLRTAWRRGAAPLALLGLAAIVAACLLYGTTTAFPGLAALLPVLGTAAVIVAARTRETGVLGRVLAVRPVQWLGDVSYSLYLWHWPLAVLLPIALGIPELWWWQRAAAVVAAAVLAWLTKILVEDPVRYWRPKAALRWVFGTAALGMAVVVGAGVAQIAAADGELAAARSAITRLEASGDAARIACLGAGAVDHDCAPTTMDGLLLGPVAALDDNRSWNGGHPDHPRSCETRSDHVQICSFGDSGSDRVVVLYGNSHAAHWTVALDAVGKAEGWRIEFVNASTCIAGEPNNAAADTPEIRAYCGELAAANLAAIRALDPELVVYSALGTPTPAQLSGLATEYRGLLADGIPVAVLRDTPRAGSSVPECLSRTRDIDGCGTRLIPDPLVDATAGIEGELAVIDLSRYFCPGLVGTDEPAAGSAESTICPAAIGDLVVYFDGSHLTDSYVETLTAPLGRAILATGLIAPRP